MVDQFRAALAVATARDQLARGIPRDALVRGLLFLPPLGAVFGAAAGGVARPLADLGAVAGAVTGVALLAGFAGGRTLRGLAAAAAPYGPWAVAAVCAAKVAALAALPVGGWPAVLLLAGMLGQWAFVVQCHGGRPCGGGLAAGLVGRARLWEFGWASAVAFGVTMALLDAVGLVVVLAAVLAAVGARVVAYRRAGGVSDAALGATVETVQVVVLAVLAALVR